MEEKKNNKSVLIAVVVIICILAFIPLGIFIGVMMVGRNTVNTANSIIDNAISNINDISNQIDNMIIDDPTSTSSETKVENSTILNQLKERSKVLSNGAYQGYSWKLYQNLALGDDSKTFITLKTLDSENRFTDLTVEQRNQEGYDCLNSYISKEEVEKKFYTMFEGSLSTDIGFPYSYKNNKYYFGGCGGYTVSYDIIAYNYKYTHIGDKYYIYQSVGVTEPLVCDDCGKVYLDIDKTKPSDIRYDSYEETDSIITQDNYSKFSQYKLEFELKNGNLIFKGISKIV